VMSELMRDLTRLLILLLLTTSIYAASSTYFQKMEGIWLRERRMEVLRGEISYLSTKADEYREAVAPLVLRLFSYSIEDDGVAVLFSGREIWRGALRDLNLTHEVEHFGLIRIGVEDSRIVASVVGMPYNYTLRTFYHEDLACVVQEALDKAGRLDDSVSKDEEELARLEEELSSFSRDPSVALFLATPLISVVLQYALLLTANQDLAGKYADLLRNPYLLLPSMAVYICFLSLTLAFHLGTLVPLHVLAVLYSLTSIPSLASPVLFAYERLME